MQKSFFSIENLIKKDNLIDLFDRASDLSTTRNNERERFINDFNKLILKYNHIPPLSKKMNEIQQQLIEANYTQ